MLEEPKAQRWRAVAVFQDGTESLLFLGSSFAQVREGYGEPWFELFEPEAHARLKEIRVEKWSGIPDRGRWLFHQVLPTPVQAAA